MELVKQTYGSVELKKYISFEEISKLLNNFEKEKSPKTQIILKIREKR